MILFSKGANGHLETLADTAADKMDNALVQGQRAANQPASGKQPANHEGDAGMQDREAQGLGHDSTLEDEN